MNIKNLSSSDALAFCSRQEDHFFDRKAFDIKPAKVQKIAVAFANADGGEVIMGVADSSQEADPQKRWNGRATIEDFNQHIQTLLKIKPIPTLRFGFLTNRLL
jgi:ATP-dependent DNA helicase RecG